MQHWSGAVTCPASHDGVSVKSDVMANRSDREQGQPTECPRHHSLRSRTGPCSWTPSGPAVSIDCINRPDRRLHPTNATTSIYLLHRGGHPQKTFVRYTTFKNMLLDYETTA